MADRKDKDKARTITFEPRDDKNRGLTETMIVTAGVCPCSVCGHKTMRECDDEQCVCCSSACT